jgi:hypothetical protein
VTKVCFKTVSQITDGTPSVIEGWVNDNPYQYGITYTLYTGSTGNTIKVGGNRYYGVIENNVIKSIVFISGDNVINNLYAWAACADEDDPNTCWVYVNPSETYSSLVDYLDCETRTWIYSASVEPRGGVCAVNNTLTVISGAEMSKSTTTCGPTPTPTSTSTPVPTPTPTTSPTPTPSPTPGGSTATPTPTSSSTPTPTPSPTPLFYDVTGSTNAGYSNSGNATGTLTIFAGHTVKVTLNVFGGTTSGGSNTGTVMGNISLNVTSSAFNVNSTQNVTLSAGVYNFTITSSYDNGKYANITFEIIS